MPIARSPMDPMNSMACIWLIRQYRHITIIESTKIHDLHLWLMMVKIVFESIRNWIIMRPNGWDDVLQEIESLMTVYVVSANPRLFVRPSQFHISRQLHFGWRCADGKILCSHIDEETFRVYQFVSFAALHYCRVNVHLRLPNNTWYVNIKCACRAAHIHTAMETVSFDLIIIYKFHILTHENLHRTTEQLNGVLFNAFTPKMILCEEKFNRILDAWHQCDENLCGVSLLVCVAYSQKPLRTIETVKKQMAAFCGRRVWIYVFRHTRK